MHNDVVAEELNRAHALPPRYYAGEPMLAMEQRAVFARSWQLVAQQGQLAELSLGRLAQLLKHPEQFERAIELRASVSG